MRRKGKQHIRANLRVFAAFLLITVLVASQLSLMAFAAENNASAAQNSALPNSGLMPLEDPPPDPPDPPDPPKPPEPDPAIPDVVGKDSSTAEGLLVNAGFVVVFAAAQYSQTVPTNMVISQSKTGQAAAGTTITLTISKGKEPPPTPTTEYVQNIILEHDIGDNQYHYVGDSAGIPEDQRKIDIEQKGKTVQLNAHYTNNLRDGVIHDAANTNTNLGVIAISWSSSDNSIATVSPSGLVTPKANGSVTISAKVSDSSKYENSAPVGKVVINFDGQSGEYVSKVTIIDKDGNVLSYNVADTMVFTEEHSSFHYYALVTWVDADGNQIRVEDTRSGGASAVSSSIVWSVGGSHEPGSINKDTGNLTVGNVPGNAQVICEVTGGVGGKTVRDYSYFQLDNGESTFPPSDSLTLEVVYEQFPTVAVQEHTYSYQSLLGMLSAYTHDYTVIYNGTTYGTTRARGFLFKDVMDLEGVELEEVYQFVFGTADATNINNEDPDANPFKISYQQLFGAGTRYYFPNWDIGNKNGAVGVPPMLAFSSNTERNTSEYDPALPLSDNSRFKLVLGSLWGMDSNSSKQIYNIFKIKIVLKGAPPADPEIGKPDPDNNNGGSGKAEDGNGIGKTGDGLDGQAGASDGSGNQQDGAGGEDNAALKELGAGAIGTALANTSHGFRVYEMMSKAKSQVEALEMENPFSPFTAPIAVGSVLAGVGFTYGGYRKRLTMPPI